MGKNLHIMVIPDAQVKPGVSTKHLEHVGMYIAEKKPDVVVNLGDWWDMESLSSYDRGKKDFEGRRYMKDIKAGNEALELLTKQFTGIKGYNPRKVLLRGNHENRMERAVDDSPELDGLIGYHHFNDIELGWEPIPFLKFIEIEGILFTHYVQVKGSNRAISSCANIEKVMHKSLICGHQQVLEYKYTPSRTGGAPIQTIIAGACYTHTERYLGQTNEHWRGILRLQGVNKKTGFSPMFIPLEYLNERYK